MRLDPRVDAFCNDQPLNPKQEVDAMDSALQLLKKEINETVELMQDLAKWKLFVTAILGAAAFGLAENGTPQYWLLLFVPFVCAYIDLYYYQYELRVGVLSRFLRENGETEEVLQKYELECDEVRKRNIYFSLGRWATLSSSLGMSAAGPVLYALHHHYYPGGRSERELLVPPSVAVVLWGVGVLLVLFLWSLCNFESGKLSGVRKQGEAGAPESKDKASVTTAGRA
jgi:hypothetical protein